MGASDPQIEPAVVAGDLASNPSDGATFAARFGRQPASTTAIVRFATQC